MKTSKPLPIAHCILILAGCVGIASAAPYGPGGRETKFTQPSGEQLTLRVFGDEYYARTETPEGYTVAYSSLDGAYYYAELSADSSALVPSKVKANKPAPAGLDKHLDLPKAQIRTQAIARREVLDGPRQKVWSDRVSAYRLMQRAKIGEVQPTDAQTTNAKIKAAPVTGDKTGLTILIQFPSDSNSAAIAFPTVRDKIVRYCNGVGYNEDGNTGSVRDFYYDQSLGKLTYTQTVTQIITVPHPRNYYNYSNYPTNTAFRNNSGNLLLTDAIAVLQKANFDFSSLSVNASGDAIATNMFFAGPDSGRWSQGLWPYMTYLSDRISVGTPANPVFISGYQMTNIEDSSPVIGTFCHENGHLLLDYPDLYDYGGDSQGVGDHCLMGGGNYNNDGKTPSPINAYFKELAGWGNIKDINAADYSTVNLPTTGNVAYRFTKPGASNESFIIENRGGGDKWAASSVDKGIAVWHIDSAVTGNDDQDMTSAKHYEVSLEQADGAFQMERNINRGDTQDLFDLGRPKFNDSSVPNARWWDGSQSGIYMQVVSAVSASTRIVFGTLPANTILLASPNGGEVIYPGSTFPVKWEANITGNVNIDLLRNDKLVGIIASNIRNNGSFDWVVPAKIATGEGFSIRISSISNAVAVSDTSTASFEISSTSFPEGGVLPLGWYQPSTADVGWQVTKNRAFEGAFSLTNKSTGDGKTAGIAYRSKFKDGRITFYIRVDSEDTYDYATFSIDGVKKSLNAEGVKRLSGREGWNFVSFPVTAGTHTFEWTYNKDDSYAGGGDSTWIDAVTVPTTTQEISVQSPLGTDLISGKSSLDFPSIEMGTTRTAEPFTVLNVGTSLLANIRVNITGADAGSFSCTQTQTSTLSPGASANFTVTFAPTTMGSKVANLKIWSNDDDEAPFNVSLSGNSLGIPKLLVFQPTDTKLTDNSGTIRLGSAVVGTTGKQKTFRIMNVGNAQLRDLSITKNGQNPRDFMVSGIGRLDLAPGESTTFKVTFQPNKIDGRTANIHILSNDRKTGSFDINLFGKGLTIPIVGTSSLAAAALDTSLLATLPKSASTTAVETFNGQKFLTLTVARNSVASGGAAVVEVSSNLLDWYSGKNHTTTLVDDSTTLKVRDNTPITPDSKRYIQLKSN